MLITDIPYKIRYGIGRLIIGCGVYPATMADLHFIVIDYWGRSSDDIKRKWIKAAKKSETTGYLLIDKNIIGDMTNYLINEKGFNPGDNKITLDLEVPSGLIIEPDYQMSVNFGNAVATFKNGSQYYSSEYEAYYYHYSSKTYLYNGNDWLAGTSGSTGTLVGYEPYWKLYNGIYSEYVWRKTNKYSEPEPRRNNITIPSQYIGNDIIVPEKYTYIGDSAGIGSTLEPEQELKVPVPPVSETDWPGGWISTIEIDSNLEDNPTVNYDDVDDSPKDWYEDENGDIYSVPSGTGPNNPGDILLKTKNKSFSYPPIYPPNYP